MAEIEKLHMERHHNTVVALAQAEIDVQLGWQVWATPSVISK